MNGDIVTGIMNAVVATYQICNVSDDKPKFILRKMSEAVPGQFDFIEQNYIDIRC